MLPSCSLKVGGETAGRKVLALKLHKPCVLPACRCAGQRMRAYLIAHVRWSLILRRPCDTIVLLLVRCVAWQSTLHLWWSPRCNLQCRPPSTPRKRCHSWSDACGSSTVHIRGKCVLERSREGRNVFHSFKKLQNMWLWIAGGCIAVLVQSVGGASVVTTPCVYIPVSVRSLTLQICSNLQRKNKCLLFCRVVSIFPSHSSVHLWVHATLLLHTRGGGASVCTV